MRLLSGPKLTFFFATPDCQLEKSRPPPTSEVELEAVTPPSEVELEAVTSPSEAELEERALSGSPSRPKLKTTKS